LISNHCQAQNIAIICAIEIVDQAFIDSIRAVRLIVSWWH